MKIKMTERLGWVGLAGLALVSAAAVFLAMSSWSLVRSGNAERSSGPAADRAQVTRVAGQQIGALNSMDPTRLDQALARWLDVSTGPLHDELQRGQAAARKRFAAAGATAQGEVAGLAVTALDPAAGNATVIASVRVRVTPARGEATEQRRRYQAGMERTPGGWKIKSLTAIAAGAS